MIKDMAQKIKAIRYCVSLGYIPHMEVMVRYEADTNPKPCDLTDIDVLAIKPGTDTETVRILFDCKTVNKVSPINRAFWAKGLMAFTHSSEAFVILTKPALETHRLAGNSFKVKLFSESMFDKYATAASTDYLVENSYLENELSWSSWYEVDKQNPKFEQLMTFLNSIALLQDDGSQGIRNLVSIVRNCSGELDPGKKMHRALFLITLSQLLLFINEMLRDFNNVFDADADKYAFVATLRYYLWGGKDNYDVRQKLNTALKGSRGRLDDEPLEFPAWDKFVNVFRTCLDAPFSLGTSCLAIKDLAFREIVDPKVDLDRKLSARFSSNNRIRQFSLLWANYLVEACKLPKEFCEYFTTEMNKLLL